MKNILTTTALPADQLASDLRKGGMTREEAKVECEALFAIHGHFPKNKKTRVRLDALKILAYFA